MTGGAQRVVDLMAATGVGPGFIRAGDDGIRYLTVHRRRGPLQIQAAPAA